MSDVFIVDLFYFQINKNIKMLLHRIKHSTGMPEYTKDKDKDKNIYSIHSIVITYMYSKI